MSFNQHQQGFSQNPGGVPYGGNPSYPQAPVGEVMQPYLPIMTAKIYNDMINRGTAYTNHMAGLYSQNGYNNELFVEILLMVAEFAEYSMATYRSDFNSVIDSVVQDCNNLLLENHHRNNPSKIPVQVTQQEVIRYQSAKTKMASLRQKISQFIADKESKMNQPYPQQGFNQQPQQNQWGQPVQQPQYNQQPQQQWQQPGMSPQQQAYMQQQQQQQQYQQQQMYAQQQQQTQQDYRQPYNGGRPPSQPGGSDFAQRVQQRMNQGMNQGQQPQFQNQFHQQPQFQNQQQQQTWNPQPNNGNQQFQQQYPQQNQWGQPVYPPQQQQFGQPGQFAVNSGQMQQQHQPPPRSSNLSNSGYDPMPQVDEAKLRQPNTSRQNVDPFARNSQIMEERQQFSQPTRKDDAINLPDGNNAESSKSFTPGANSSHKTESIPSNSPEAQYERRVRSHAVKFGLPIENASLSYLEEQITLLDPKNGFIDVKNAYSEQASFKNHGEPQGHYGHRKDALNDEDITTFTTSADMTSDSFATQMRNQMADKSDKQMIKQADGSWQLVSNDIINAFQQEFPNIDINTVDMRRYKENAPYTFAIMNMEGDWTVPADKHAEITDKGWFEKPAIYPVYTRMGFYVVSPEGTITDFFSRPKTNKEMDMEFELHDDSKFFSPQSPKDLKSIPDESKLLDTFANLQVQQKVSEVLTDIEEQAGVIDGEDAALVINKTVVIEEQVNGELLGDDYYTQAYSALRRETGEMVIEYADVSFRYKHVHMYPWLAKGSDMKALRKLRYKEDYLEIAEVLADISEVDGMTQSWFTRLNDVATRYVNQVIENQFPLNDADYFYIKSFCLEVGDAVDEMTRLGYGDAFKKTAKRLTNTLLYAWDDTSPVFSDYFEDVLEENEDGVSSEVSVTGFGIVRDITVIPLHSRDVPLHTEKEKCLLTKHGFNNLWQVAKERIDNRDARTSEIVIVTSDNRHMYLSETAVDDVYAITKKSLFE